MGSLPVLFLLKRTQSLSGLEDHGGYIWATSKEDEGTCMHFVLRKYKEQKGNEKV